MKQKSCDISIIIRTKNEEKYLKEVLDKIFLQEINKTFEVIIVDSGSIDNTLAIARSYPLKIVTISSEKFTYTYALQKGIGQSKGKLLVFLSAHATPLSHKWLDTLIKPLEDKKIAGCFGKEIPRKFSHPYEELSLNALFLKLPPGLRKNSRTNSSSTLMKNIFSNVNSCIRKTILQQIPFRELPYAEDHDWAKRILEQGYFTYYEPAAEVLHSHEDSFFIRAKRISKWVRSKELIYTKHYSSLYTLKSLIGLLYITLTSNYLNLYKKIYLLIYLPLLYFWVFLLSLGGLFNEK